MTISRFDNLEWKRYVMLYSWRARQADHCFSEISNILIFISKCGVFVANLLPYDLIVSEFELQLRYFIHFRAYILRKGMNSFIHPAMG